MGNSKSKQAQINQLAAQVRALEFAMDSRAPEGITHAQVNQLIQQALKDETEKQHKQHMANRTEFERDILRYFKTVIGLLFYNHETKQWQLLPNSRGTQADLDFVNNFERIHGPMI